MFHRRQEKGIKELDGWRNCIVEKRTGKIGCFKEMESVK